MVCRVKAMIGPQHLAVMSFKCFIRFYRFQVFGSHDKVIQLVSFVVNRLQGGEGDVSIAVSAVSFIIIQPYYLINHISGIDKLPDRLGMRFIEKNLCCLFMEHNYFPALFNINFIDETSFEEFHHFYFRMVGIYAGKIQTDVFLSET